jgi:CRISPR/Cas system endoribonuclease Cas6 (RAMP superfamily)
LKWNSFAPDALQINQVWSEFAANCIMVSKFNVHSEMIKLYGNNPQYILGCVENVTYRLLPEIECAEYSSFWRNADLIFRLLAEYSMFSGVGYHTNTGLGQTIWL